MPKIQEHVLPCSLNMFGDLVCPYCDCNIMTDPHYQLQPGTGTCGRCKKRFTLDHKTAVEGNRRARYARNVMLMRVAAGVAI